MFLDDARDFTLQLRSVAFILKGGQRVAGRVHEVEGGPGANAVLVPGGLVGVVENGVMYVVAGDGALQGFVVFFVLELGGVDAYDGESVAEAFFERPDLL